MKMLKTALLIALSTQFAFAASLEDLQSKAVENRDLVKKYQINVEKYAQDVRKARAGYLPSASIGYVVNKLDEPGLTEDKNNSVFTATLSYNIFAGFKDKYNLKSAKLMKQAQEFQLNAVKEDLKLSVALKYIDVYNKVAGLKVAKDQNETIQKLYSDSEAKFNVGMLSKNDLLKIKVNLDDSFIALKQAEAELNKSINNLSRDAGVELTLADLGFEDLAAMPETAPVDENKSLMMQNRSELKYLKNISESYSSSVKSAQSGYYPKVDASLGYKRYDNRYANGAGDYDRLRDGEVRAALTLSLNIFDGLVRESTISSAEKASQMALLDISELKLDLANALVNSYEDYNVSKINVKTAEINIEQAEENLRITKLSYNEGLSTLSDLLDAVANVSRAKYSRVNAVTGLYSNYFQILRTVEK